MKCQGGFIKFNIKLYKLNVISFGPEITKKTFFQILKKDFFRTRRVNSELI